MSVVSNEILLKQHAYRILSGYINQDVCTTWVVAYVFGNVVDCVVESVDNLLGGLSQPTLSLDDNP